MARHRTAEATRATEQAALGDEARVQNVETVVDSDGADAAGRAAPVDDDTDAEARGHLAEHRVFALHDRPGPDETRVLIDHLRSTPPDAPLVLDAGAVEATATPYLLALAAAARERARAGAPAVLANPSAAIVDGFSDLGLFQDLMKMEFRP